MSAAAKQGKLVICPTPLGNLGDMTPRALEALRAADLIYCEDTRVTGKLLAALGVKGKPLERMDEVTIRTSVNRVSAKPAYETDDLMTFGDLVIARVLEGENLVFCSDAGMPGISDPGALLVSLAREFDAPVEVLPGPTAATTAYVASGFTCPRFYFGGFFPRKKSERAAACKLAKDINAVSVYYESPHRLVACLGALAEALPARQVAVCRELSKLHEEVVVGSALDVHELFTAREEQDGIKGEIVVVIDVATSDESEVEDDQTLQAAKARATELLAAGEMSKKDMAAALKAEFAITRNAAYEFIYGA